MPVPTIYLIDNNNEITEMKGQPYDSEERLQNFLAQFPSVLAGDQMSGSTPLKWLLIKREAGIPGEDGGAERWSVDHLFIDQNGIPTLVEVKRSTDTRIRREVVGQMLDYAANAVQYWPIATIRQWFEETCRERDFEPNVHLAQIIGITQPTDEAIAHFWETVETNLRAGRLRLIFAADEIPPELRRIIEFLDEQMTPTEVLGIEIRQYVGANGHTLVPSVIRSSRKSTPTTGRTGVRWDEESFTNALLQRRGSEAVTVAKKILEWASTQDVTLWWGQGRVDGSCTLGINHEGVSYYVFALWTYGRIQMQFQTLQQRAIPLERIEGLASGLSATPGIHMPADVLKRYPSFEMSLLKEPQSLTQFLKVIGSFVEQIRTAAKGASATVAG